VEKFILFRIRRKKGLKYLKHFDTRDKVDAFLGGKKEAAQHRYLIVQGQTFGQFPGSTPTA
jgi:hypothetical protein